MKKYFGCMLASLLFILVSLPVQAQVTAARPGPAYSVPTLPYGVDDILRLTLAGVNEDVILKYIEVAATSYQLEANHLIYLRDQGVSDRIINAMLDQRLKVQNTPPPSSQSTPSPTATSVAHSEPGHHCPLVCRYCGGLMFSYEAPSRPVSTLHIIPYTSAVGRSSVFWNWGPYRYYGNPFFTCGWWPYPCGHWHGCRPWGFQ